MIFIGVGLPSEWLWVGVAVRNASMDDSLADRRCRQKVPRLRHRLVSAAKKPLTAFSPFLIYGQNHGMVRRVDIRSLEKNKPASYQVVGW
jgi:hypothetical protein